MDGISAGISGIGVSAQGVALSANNVANLNTDGYKAKTLGQQDLQQGGVRASGIGESQEPTNPGGSNVDLATEAVNLDTRGLSYKADLKFLQVQQNLLGVALDMKA
ncbi:flagellar basal body protein [Geothrix sp. 21YS21S-2]|uniref:flagellar basal body protein n=1 Tax=Geothrix sp. 21YS21S-2 TaxID=3068893 RepID=UPI0027B8F900|nr:flagellar basal body protein [Geothrix sp. 21YS21S-2]